VCSSDLGTSSDGKAVWRNITGTWQTNGSVAVSLSAASNKNITVADIDGSNISNLQIDIGTGGGVGLSFWVTSANSYYALYPSYGTSTSTNNVCDAVVSQTGGYSGSCCGGNSTSTRYRYVSQCSGGLQFTTYETYSTSGNAYANSVCYPESGTLLSGPTAETIYTCNTPRSVTTTTYNSTLNLIKVESGSQTSLVSTNYISNTSNFSKTQSIAISTSGNTISYSLYSSAGKSGSVLSSGSNTPSSPVKGTGVGLFHTTSNSDQGSTFSNFSVTTTV
jgi:hypothetical protein